MVRQCQSPTLTTCSLRLLRTAKFRRAISLGGCSDLRKSKSLNRCVPEEVAGLSWVRSNYTSASRGIFGRPKRPTWRSLYMRSTSWQQSLKGLECDAPGIEPSIASTAFTLTIHGATGWNSSSVMPAPAFERLAAELRNLARRRRQRPPKALLRGGGRNGESGV
jgi:hypothetical protein